MLKNVPTMLSGLLLLASLSACERAGSRPVANVYTPRLDQYAPEFQIQLADEIEASSFITCPRDILVPNCVAWKRMVVDYVYLRDRIRAAEGVVNR